MTSCPYLGDGAAGAPSLSMMYFRPDLVVNNLTPSSVTGVAGPCEKEGVATPSISAFAIVGIVNAVAMVEARKFRLLSLLLGFG